MRMIYASILLAPENILESTVEGSQERAEIYRRALDTLIENPCFENVRAFIERHREDFGRQYAMIHTIQENEIEPVLDELRYQQNTASKYSW